MKNYPTPKLFQPSEEEIASAAQRFVKESKPENTAHFPELNPATKNNLKLHLEHVSAVWALEKLIALHDREAEGDETITMKEWNAAITAGKAVLNTATN